jgi:hypothetical protein
MRDLMLQVNLMMKELGQFRFHKALVCLLFPLNQIWNLGLKVVLVGEVRLQQDVPFESQEVADDVSQPLVQLEAVDDVRQLLVHLEAVDDVRQLLVQLEAVDDVRQLLVQLEAAVDVSLVMEM